MISTATPFVLRMHGVSFQRDDPEHDPRSRTSFPSARHEHGRHAAPTTGNRALEPLNSIQHGGDMGSTEVGSQSGMPGYCSPVKQTDCNLNADNTEYALAA